MKEHLQITAFFLLVAVLLSHPGCKPTAPKPEPQPIQSTRLTVL